jgi:hypothetical protein
MNERTGRPRDGASGGGWDDDRLAAAYRSLAAGPVPADLTRTTLAAAEAASRAGRWWGWAGGTRRRPRFAAAGGLLVAGLVAILIGSLALRSTLGQGPGGNGALAAGLSVRSVSELLAAEAGGSIHGDDLVAVRGWIVQELVPACPYQPPSPALEDTCTSRKLLMTETPQTLVTFQPVGAGMSETELAPSGPHLYARELTGNYVDPVISSVLDAGNSTVSPYRALEAILVGHFHDVRAAECSAEQRAACEAAFVVDQVAWLDGKSLGPNVWIGGDAGGRILNPRLDAAGVASALAPSLHSTDTIVSMAAVQLMDITTITGAGNQVSGMGEEIIWYVRVAGPPPPFPALAWGTGNGGWMVLDDATGHVLGAGGWGFVPANSASYSPSAAPSLAGGLYRLPTVGWLPGNVCAGVGLDAVLRGSPTDARVAWLDSTLGGPARLDVTWPAGYHARFTPNIEILDENGTVVLRNGDTVTGACDNNPDGGLLYLQPPFR